MRQYGVVVSNKYDCWTIAVQHHDFLYKPEDYARTHIFPTIPATTQRNYSPGIKLLNDESINTITVHSRSIRETNEMEIKASHLFGGGLSGNRNIAADESLTVDHSQLRIEHLFIEDTGTSIYSGMQFEKSPGLSGGFRLLHLLPSVRCVCWCEFSARMFTYCLRIVTCHTQCLAVRSEWLALG